MEKIAGVHEKGTFSIDDMMRLVKENPHFHKVGALALFVGVVRGETEENEKVEGLELEAYEEKADEVLNNICEELEKTPGVIDVQIHHLLGSFNVGEELVYVLVAGQHRTNVFKVLEKAVERYKKEAPIFKKEHIVSRKGEKEAYWISEHKR